TPFIADFVGTSNIIDADVVEVNDQGTSVDFQGYKIVSNMKADKETVQLIIRPENIIVMSEGANSNNNIIEGVVDVSTYLGSSVRYDVKVGETTIIVDSVYESGESIFKQGAKVKLSIDPERVLLI